MIRLRRAKRKNEALSPCNQESFTWIILPGRSVGKGRGVEVENTSERLLFDRSPGALIFLEGVHLHPTLVRGYRMDRVPLSNHFLDQI